MFLVRANQQVYLLFPVKVRSRKGANKDTESCVKHEINSCMCTLSYSNVSGLCFSLFPFIFIKHKQLVKTTLLVCTLHVFPKITENIWSLNITFLNILFSFKNVNIIVFHIPQIFIEQQFKKCLADCSLH